MSCGYNTHGIMLLLLGLKFCLVNVQVRALRVSVRAILSEIMSFVRDYALSNCLA